MVSIATFQAVDLGSIPSQCIHTGWFSIVTFWHCHGGRTLLGYCLSGCHVAVLGWTHNVPSNDIWWHKQMFVVWKCVSLAFISHKLCNMSMFNNVVHPLLLLSETVPPRLELGSLDSESRVLTITPWNPETWKIGYAWRHMCQFSIIFNNSFALTHLNFIM